MGHAHVGKSGKAATSRRDLPKEKLVPINEYSVGRPAIVGFVAMVFALIYAYWPTLVWAEDSWRNESDYSHGYLVVPLAALLCWHRRDSFPGIRPQLSWVGLSLMGLGILMRVVSRLVYADFFDGWSILPMVAGAIWLLAGPAALRWSLPAVAFLFLMIPMPYQAESLLSWKLQGFATNLSTIFLRVLGFAAVSESHVIWLGDERLEVAAACSGMRIFMGVIALAFFWAAMMRRGWIDRIVLMAASIPLAIFVNAVRITAIGVMYTWFPSDSAHRAIHTNSGLLMIPFAFVLLWGFKSYWEQLYRPNEQISASQLAHRPA